MMPSDIVKVLAAAAPIVASVASIANKENKPEIVEKESPTVNNISISVTNNNHFYGTPNTQTIQAASNIGKSILDTIAPTGPRYII